MALLGVTQVNCEVEVRGEADVSWYPISPT